MTCHPLVFQLIQLGQHTTYENSEPFCELMRTYLQEEPNERLQQAVRNMELWHTKDTSSYFYPAHFAAMDELYRLANFTPAKSWSWKNCSTTTRNSLDSMNTSSFRSKAKRTGFRPSIS